MKASAKSCCVGISILVILLAIGHSASAYSATPKAVDDINTIMSAWKKRQSQATSVRVSWRQLPSRNSHLFSYQMEWPASSQVEHAAPDSLLLLDETRSRYETNRWYVPVTMEYSGFTERGKSHYSPEDIFYRLYFHDTPQDSYRKALQNEFRNPADQQRLPRRLVSIRDGITRRDLFDKGDGQYAQAMIFDWPTIADGLDEILDHLQFRPLILMYRPLHPALGAIRPESCRLVAQKSFANGSNCLVFEESRRDRVVNKYWVDPDRDFVVVRQITEQAGASRAQLDISYRQDAALGWCPTGWTTMIFPRVARPSGYERLMHGSGVEVNRIDINDASIHADFRDIVIPAATLVVDRTRQEAFITLANDQKRMITRIEAADPTVTYRKLTTSMGAAFFNLLWSRAPQFLLVVICIVLGRSVVSHLLIRRTIPSPDALTVATAPSKDEFETDGNADFAWKTLLDHQHPQRGHIFSSSTNPSAYRANGPYFLLTMLLCFLIFFNIATIWFPSYFEQALYRFRILVTPSTELFACFAVVSLGTAIGLKKK